MFILHNKSVFRQSRLKVALDCVLMLAPGPVGTSASGFGRVEPSGWVLRPTPAGQCAKSSQRPDSRWYSRPVGGGGAAGVTRPTPTRRTGAPGPAACLPRFGSTLTTGEEHLERGAVLEIHVVVATEVENAGGGGRPGPTASLVVDDR